MTSRVTMDESYYTVMSHMWAVLLWTSPITPSCRACDSSICDSYGRVWWHLWGVRTSRITMDESYSTVMSHMWVLLLHSHVAHASLRCKVESYCYGWVLLHRHVAHVSHSYVTHMDESDDTSEVYWRVVLLGMSAITLSHCHSLFYRALLQKRPITSLTSRITMDECYYTVMSYMRVMPYMIGLFCRI